MIFLSFEHEGFMDMVQFTVKETRDAIKALPGMTAGRLGGEWRVTVNIYRLSEQFPDKGLEWCEHKQEAVAYYTEDADDALATARDMSGRWVASALGLTADEP
jgi:hypothetical protein